MSEEIKVHVVDYGRKALYMRFRDPVTGKQSAKSTGTARQREADKIAAKWEADLQEGRYKSPSKVTWTEFRERFEAHLDENVCDSTAYCFHNVANVFERIVNPERLVAVKEPQIKQFVRNLRDNSKSIATVRSYLAQLKVGFRWAKKHGLMTEVPPMTVPNLKRNGKVIKKQESRGRAIVSEEFERMLAAVEPVLYRPRKDGRLVLVDGNVVESWQHLLHGLFWSGLRISEAHLLTWDHDTLPAVDFTGKRPMIWIPGQFQKNGKDTRSPMSPEFYKFLMQTPEAERTGFVFNPVSTKIASRLGLATFKRRISDFGRKANVKVKDMESGKVKHASAHDLRRSFGFRWSHRVMPAVLQQLMRHASIQTSMTYYGEGDAEETAKAVWMAVPGVETASGGNNQVTLGCKAADAESVAGMYPIE